MNLNNPFGDNYPFIGPPGNLPTDTKYVYDIYITYYDPVLAYKLPLKIISISKSAINLVDADGATVFNDILTSTLWGTEYTILQGTDTDKNLCISAIVSNDLTGTYSPVNGDICLRCVYTQPKHITSFEVDDIKLQGDIVFDLGYNSMYTVDEPTSGSVRPFTSILLAFKPGSGLGTRPKNCKQLSTPIVSINGQTADENHNIHLLSDECLKVSQVDEHSISIIDECVPCCQCADFMEAALIMDAAINDYYVLGSTAESVRDCLADLVDLLSCGGIALMAEDTLCPVRSYLDTTWPRHPCITAEFRNVLPAKITNLKLKVTMQCSPLLKHQALRTIQLDELTCDGTGRNSQAADNYARIYAADPDEDNWEFTDNIPRDKWEACNCWIIDYTDQTLAPGDTLWCTVGARNSGVDPKSGEIREDVNDSWKESEDEQALLKVEAQYDLEGITCNNDPSTNVMDCIQGREIRNAHMSTGIIKGGYGFDDYTADGDFGAKARIKEICMDLHDGKWS